MVEILYTVCRGHAKIFTISEPLTKPSIINENKSLWLQVANY